MRRIPRGDPEIISNSFTYRDLKLGMVSGENPDSGMRQPKEHKTYERDGIEYTKCEMCDKEIIKTKSKRCIDCVGEKTPDQFQYEEVMGGGSRKIPSISSGEWVDI